MLFVILGAAAFAGGNRLARNLYTTASVATVYAMEEGRVSLVEPGRPGEGNLAYHALPLGPGVRIVDERGRRMDQSRFSPKRGTPLEVIRKKDGTVVELKVVRGGTVLEGTVDRIGPTDVVVSGQTYTLAQDAVFFLADGVVLPGREGIHEADLVRVSVWRGRAVAVEVVVPSGLLRIGSSLEGATVYADGKARGRVPLDLRLSPGQHEIRLRAPGHEDAVMEVLVEPGKEMTLALDPGAPEAGLLVDTVPQGAEVILDGQTRGTSPLRLAVLPGYHDLEVRKTGYVSQSRRVLSKKGETHELTIELQVDPDAPLTREDVTAVAVSQDGTRLTVRYDDGSRATLDVSNVPLYQGLFSAQWTRVSPGERLELYHHPAGFIAKAVKTTANRFRVEGTLMWISGDEMAVSDRFYRCRLNPGALILKDGVETSPSLLVPGDRVVVSGSSAQDIRYVEASDVLGERHPLEAFVLKSRDRYGVFTDDGELPWFSPAGDLKLVDATGSSQVPLSSVPSGSRVRFYFDMSGRIVWAELVFRAASSEEGTVAFLEEDGVFLSPSWKRYVLSGETAVYRQGTRGSPHDLRVGDSAVVAADEDGTLRFVYVRDRIEPKRIVPIVLGSQVSKEGRVAWLMETREEDEPPSLVVNFRTASYPAERRNVPFQRLGPGDRLKLWLDDEDRVLWAEIVSVSDVRVEGYYMGQRDGKLYFAGFVSGVPSPRAVLVGFQSLEDLGPGSKVVASLTGGIVDYIEALDVKKAARYYSGTVLLAAGGYLHMYMPEGWLLDIPVEKDSAFVDWNENSDGRVDELFPGDRVRVYVDSDMDYVWAERRSRPQFRIEGQIDAVYERRIVLRSKSYILSPDVVVYKNGNLATVSSLLKGDRVRMAGRDGNNIEVVVVGW